MYMLMNSPTSSEIINSGPHLGPHKCVALDAVKHILMYIKFTNQLFRTMLAVTYAQTWENHGIQPLTHSGSPLSKILNCRKTSVSRYYRKRRISLDVLRNVCVCGGHRFAY